MNQYLELVNTVLKKVFPTAKAKFEAVMEKEGDNIKQANKSLIVVIIKEGMKWLK